MLKSVNRHVAIGGIPRVRMIVESVLDPPETLGGRRGLPIALRPRAALPVAVISFTYLDREPMLEFCQGHCRFLFAWVVSALIYI
jgi:hypothetical protein